MGGGDLNSKKAWHPNTLKNQERVWKAEQAAAEEKKRMVELERERHLERERAELNKLAKGNLAQSNHTGDDRLRWMYEKPDKKVQQEEYLLGKAIDKNHEQPGRSDADEIPAVSRRVVGSSMLTIASDTQVDLARKMREDPLLLVKERERAARAALLNNPVQRARLTLLLRQEQESKKESKSKKKKKEDQDLDNVLAEKLQSLNSKKGIDLAALLASDDSSSDSSAKKSRKKKKKKEKKFKSHKVTKHDNDIDDHQYKSKCDFQNLSKKYSTSVKHKRAPSKSDEDVFTKRKKSHHSIANDSIKSNARESPRDSNSDHNVSDDQNTEDTHLRKSTSNYVKGHNYWSNKPYININLQSKGDLSSSREGQTKGQKDRRKRHSSTEKQKRDHQYRYKQESQHNNNNTTKSKMDKLQLENASSSFENGWRSKKRSSGLSEDEKAAKLAEMVAAGAEREQQRERRVASQLAEKEAEDQLSKVHSGPRNVIRQLPDSLESRIHSNRHYIQRDQRKMDENFAKR